MPVKRTRFSARRRTVGFSQEQFAERVNVDRSSVARWEAGEAEPQPWLRPRIAHALQVSVEQLDDLLGEGRPAESAQRPDDAVTDPGSAGLAPRNAPYTGGHPVLDLPDPDRGEPVDRRKFITASAGASVAALAADPVLSLLAAIDNAPLPAAIRPSDIEQVRSAARLFTSWGHAYGGGILREAVTTQLRWSAGLLESQCSQPLRLELFSAVGDLSGVCGFMAFDAYAHDDARRIFAFGLSCAEQAGDWHLRARLLTNMARQATWCGDPDTGLTHAELALVRPDRLAASEQAWLQATRARALANLGRAQEAIRAVGQADDAFAARNPAEDPPWMAFYDDAEHASDTGHSLFDITANGTPQADAAVRLRAAVGGYREAYARSRMMTGERLATLLFTHGDPHEAAIIGHQAVDDAQRLRSHRVADRLRQLRQASSQHTELPEARELGERITQLVGAV
jgi:transcriptional regulator with XRE-family HTH domain